MPGVPAIAVLIASIAVALTTLGPDGAAAEPQPVAARSPPTQESLVEAAYKYFPSDAAALARKRLYRLTRNQIDATVSALLPGLPPRPVRDVMGKDPLQTNYEYADLLSVNASNANALSGWIAEIAANVRKTPERVIDCGAAKNSDVCLSSAAGAFAARAFRGDVGKDKLDRIAKFYLASVRSAGIAEATASLVEVVLNSPDFLFRKEIDVDEARRLVPAQLLQALTYTLADAPPETFGIDARAFGPHLPKGEVARTTIDSILATNEAREKLVRFFLTWLEVKDPQGFTISPQVYPEFTPRLAAAMVVDTARYLAAHLSGPSPRLSDITQSTHAFVSEALAPVYGTAPADPAGARPAALDASQRLGIFSLPAVIASHSGPTNTRPIKRGIFWVRKVMCMELDPPPNGIDSTLDDTLATTERKRIEHATRRKACVGCHKLIDPLGFVQESYDALGRWRTQDNGFPVDTSIAIDFLDEADTSAASPVEAFRAFTSSMRFKQCFVRQLFRFYMGRSEEPSDDPLLRRAFFALAQNDDILEVVRMLASSDALVRRQ